MPCTEIEACFDVERHIRCFVAHCGVDIAVEGFHLPQVVDASAALEVEEDTYAGSEVIVGFHIWRYVECRARIDGYIEVHAELQEQIFALIAQKWRNRGNAQAAVLACVVFPGVEVERWKRVIRSEVEPQVCTHFQVVLNKVFGIEIDKERSFFGAVVVVGELDTRFAETAVAESALYAIGVVAVVATALPTAAHEKLHPLLRAEYVFAEVVCQLNGSNHSFFGRGCFAHCVVVEDVEIK